MINQGQTLRQVQRLSPVQIQTIKLVGLPVLDLEQTVRKELEENPALDDTPLSNDEESSREVSLDSVEADDSIPEYRLRMQHSSGVPRPEFGFNLSVKDSFTQSLNDQLGFLQVSERCRAIASFIIGSLDADGYLKRDTDSLVDDLAFHAGIDASAGEVEEALAIVQGLEPVGVGARNLRECLLLQLRSKRPVKPVSDAIAVLDVCYDDFVEKRFKKILSRCGISESELKEAINVISKLNPAPGGGIDDSYDDIASRVVPDFVLKEDGGKLSYEMPRSNIPSLKVSRQYEQFLQQPVRNDADRQAAEFAKQKINSAKWFIEALKQRQMTLKKCMDAIIELQSPFLVSGDEDDLRPMILEDVAKIAGLDISTISRVVNNKYVETSFGIIPMRYLFSEKMSTQDGGEVSARAIRKALQEIVDAEDKHAPLTDEQLVDALTASGFKIARRTVAKYRDQLGIPLARWRKEV
ncbi:MAG: RNA polymerase factor sigma-54 [Bacteroidales bacterium]|nr:RNA polymerase factor sigma-54 [Bacteroidales bacterium]